MTLDQQIESILRTMYDAGKTQEDIGRAFHISQQYVQRLLSGQRKISGLTVKVLMKMFPKATLNINGNNIVGDISGVNQVVVGDNGTINGTPPVASAEDFRNKAMKSLLDLEISPDALVKVLKTIKDLKI